MICEGDFYILRTGGVWRAERVEAGSVRFCRHPNGETRVLAEDAEEIVRPAAGPEALREALARAGYVRTIRAAGARARREMCAHSMEQYDEIEWLRVIKTLYWQARDGRLRPEDEQLDRRARDYLHGEVSAVLGIPLDGVEAHIAELAGSDEW